MKFSAAFVTFCLVAVRVQALPPPYAGSRYVARQAADQDSLTLDASVVQTTDNGQNPPVAGQAAAQTSKNNFINFCAPTLATLPITNGLQTTTGSCNPVPIGQIPSTANIPSAKFQSPTNGATIQSNTPFNITLQAKNIQLGQFTNAAKTYFANPQTLNAQGQIIGHTHIVIEAIPSLDSTAVTDATKFAFFKGIDGAADAQGNVQATVAAGLPAGAYRMGTIMSSATHQPVIVAIAQHGLCDDVIYMTVSDSGAAAAPPAAAAAPPAAAATTAAAAPPAAAAAGAAAAGAPANGGPAFDPAGAPHVGNGAGAQFIGGQCLSAADCGSGCCAGPSGICSGPGAATQAGKTGCGFVAPGKRAFGL